MKPKDIVIYGSGETAILAYEYFKHDSPHNVAAFTVDAQFRRSDELLGLPLIDFDEVEGLFPPSDNMMFAASGSAKLNRIRTLMYERGQRKGYRFASYVSSRAFRWHNTEIGENCLILEHNTLQPFTRVGNNVVMWSSNHLGHRSIIEDNCFITSHVVISGSVTIGGNSFVGVNACFADNITIGPDNYITMGAAVQRSTEPDSIYSGSPAAKREIPATRFAKVGK